LRIRDGLAAKDRATIEVAAQRLQDDESRVSQSRGVVGGMLNSLQTFEARLTANIELFTLETTTLVDADLSETVTELALQQTALQAALASGAQLLQGSLLDFI
jgi:flagellar hook-associated protein 3 FlgL